LERTFHQMSGIANTIQMPRPHSQNAAHTKQNAMYHMPVYGGSATYTGADASRTCVRVCACAGVCVCVGGSAGAVPVHPVCAHRDC
jgi:hypothetical protein